MASEFAGDIEDFAARIMYELLGRRWVYPYITTTETIHLAPGQRALVLNGRPVVSIESVTFTGETDQLDYTLENKHRIRLDKAPIAYAPGFAALYPTMALEGGVCSKRSIDVRFTYGAKPPTEVLFAIEVLTKEMRLAVEESDECRLPQRVTSVTRNGMTMTVLDSQDFLNEGRTGIEEVDAAIMHYNPAKAKRPARVFGRMSPPPIRTNTVRN